MNLSRILRWIARGVSVGMLLFLLGFLFAFSSSAFLLAKMMVTAAFVLASLIAWKNEPIGGSILIILGSISLLVVMGKQLAPTYFLLLVPSFVSGTTFIVDYLYQEKLEDREEIDF